MVNTKVIAVGIAAVILIVAVTAYASSYMSDFNNVQRSSQDEGQTIALTDVPVLGSKNAGVTIVIWLDVQPLPMG